MIRPFLISTSNFWGFEQLTNNKEIRIKETGRLIRIIGSFSERYQFSDFYADVFNTHTQVIKKKLKELYRFLNVTKVDIVVGSENLKMPYFVTSNTSL
tara:strand:+ start:103 stop:396 length:294 start_codon:yes stop_codon:yes gene_type:complete